MGQRLTVRRKIRRRTRKDGHEKRHNGKTQDTSPQITNERAKGIYQFANCRNN